MANAAVANILLQQTIGTNATNTLARGLRVVLNSDGSYSLAGATVRGDFVTLQPIPASSYGLAGSMEQGGSIPIVCNGTSAVGDVAYSAANGQVSNTSTNAVVVGKFRTAGVDQTFAMVQLENPV